MNTESTDRRTARLSSCGIATMLLFASLALAKSYDILVETKNLKATPVEKPLPVIPDDADLKKRQEGWVQLNFSVSPEGRAVDPIVVLSVGGDAFEVAAVDAIRQWTFEPGDDTRRNNTVSLSFKNDDGKDDTSRNFMRWYNMAARKMMDGDFAAARERLEKAQSVGGWNLYERTLFEVLKSEVHRGAGESDAQLAALRLAVEIDNETAMNKRSKQELLKNIFELEVESQQYAAAQRTLDALRNIDGSDKTIEALQEKIAEMENAVESDVDISISAVLNDHGDCDHGEALWGHEPLRRSFGFEGVDGQVERFEARCDDRLLSAAVGDEERWFIPEEWGHCELFVFGKPGSRFKLVEFADGGIADDAVAGLPAN